MGIFTTLLVAVLAGVSVFAGLLWRAKNSETEARKKAEAEAEEWRKQHELRAGDIASLETELKNSRTAADESINQVKQAMRDEFKNLSQEVLDEKRKKFDEESSVVLKPVRDELAAFQKRLNEIHGEDIKERSALSQQIQTLKENAEQYGKSADNLALALKGDSKTQGDWGEIQLETLLQHSGLRKGEEYEAQPSTRGENGEVLRPDFKINLPDNKHLVVDSKVSLRDYDDFCQAEDKDGKDAALARHVKAVKNHVNGLSGKHYASAQGINAPDFVFLFMHLEPALMLALHAEPRLFQFAYEKNIILCSPTNLMAIMRTVERIWRVERQNKNAEEIAKQGGKIYDKLSGFLGSMEDVGKALEKAQTSYEKANSQLKDGSGNLVRQVEKLKTLGALPNKKLPDDYADVSADNVENDGDSENITHLPPPA